MKHILYLTTLASPYRIEFFDELGSYMDVTVLFSDRKDAQYQRSEEWFGRSEGGFHQVQLDKKRLSTGNGSLCTDVIPWLKRKWDAIVICGYSSPTAILAILYLKLKKIPFYMEVDGGLIREDGGFRYRIKKYLVSAADGWFSSGPYTTKYLTHYGARAERVFEYPFTSLGEGDIAREIPSREEKARLREKLGMEEKQIVLYVGRFTEEKGMPDLLHGAPGLSSETGVYFVGQEPGREHLDFCLEKGLSHVHFVGFRKKEALADYYRAADVLVLPTRSDVWGLVINEAMACGLPVITTDKCVAGLELVKNGVNGWIVPVSDQKELEQAIGRVLASDCRRMGREALEAIRPYTIENMVKAHVKILQ